jgi:hypothetical protein
LEQISEATRKTNDITLFRFPPTRKKIKIKSKKRAKRGRSVGHDVGLGV